MAIRLKERELTAVAISVAAGCRPCTDYHIKAARKARASDDHIGRAVAVALRIRRRAANVMEAHALRQLGMDGVAEERKLAAAKDRTELLARIGAAYAVNCTTSLEAALAEAGSIGITEQDMAEIAKLAAFIKGKAVSHVEHLLAAPVAPVD